jgi:acetoin utilization protein AcuB
MHQIPIRQIMKTPVITIQPDQLVADAAQMMQQYNIRRLPVVDADGYLVGIVTDSDVREAESAEGVLHNYSPELEEEWLAVGDVMTHEVITIDVDATVGELAAKFLQHKVGGLPVVTVNPVAPKGVQLVGIVSEIDVFALIAAAWKAESGVGHG